MFRISSSQHPEQRTFIYRSGPLQVSESDPKVKRKPIWVADPVLWNNGRKTGPETGSSRTLHGARRAPPSRLNVGHRVIENPKCRQKQLATLAEGPLPPIPPKVCLCLLTHLFSEKQCSILSFGTKEIEATRNNLEEKITSN